MDPLLRKGRKPKPENEEEAKSKMRKKNKATRENMKTPMQLGGPITHLRYT